MTADTERRRGVEPRQDEGAFAHVDRPRVRERIREALRYRIAMIVAPAGFGKSVAIQQSLAPRSCAVRYDVPRDAGLPAFVRGLADALARVAPGLQASLASALDGARRSTSPGRELATWAAAHLASADVLVVVDDLQNAEGEPETSRFLADLVERTKAGPRWLISSRSALELPVASWIAYGHCSTVVDIADLRFTPAEAYAAARAAGAELDRPELDDVVDLVEGWPVALAFALRTSTGARDLRGLSAGTREMIYHYLAEQVWHALDERARVFLESMVFYPLVESRIAVAAGFDDVMALTDSLRTRVAFISVVDDGVYRLHDLFRDFIRARIRLRGEDAYRTAIVTAARSLEAFGLCGEALTRYVAAGASDDVERVVAAQHIRIFESVSFDVVERAVAALVAAGRVGSAPILAVRAALESAHGRVARAEHWYAAVLGRASEYDTAFRVAVTIEYAILLFNQARPEAVPPLEALLERDDLTPSERSGVLSMLAASDALRGRAADARLRIREALELAELCDDRVRARIFARAAITAFYGFDSLATERYAGEAVRLFTLTSDFGGTARALIALTTALFSAGRLSEAAAAAEQTISSALRAGDPETRAAGCRALVEIAAERGDWQRVIELDRSLRGTSYRGRHGEPSYARGMALLHGAKGNLDEALSALLSGSGELPVFSFEHCLREVMSACLEAALGRRERATKALANADAAFAHHVCEPTPFRFDWALVERFSVLANILSNRKARARDAMRALRYRFPQHEGFDRVLAALIDRAPAVVERSLDSLRAADLAGLAAFVEALTAEYVNGIRHESELAALTPAERQVLAGMVAGMSNQAIADEQRRALNTVRVHVSSILHKLGVSSRAQAVALVTRERSAD